MYQHEELYIL